jgi:hypothetical protein
MRKALLLLALCGLLFAAGSPVAGVWKVISTGPGPDDQFTWKMTVTEADGKIAATLAGDMGEFPVADAKFDKDVLTGKITMDANTYAIEFKVDGNKGSGNWKSVAGTEGGTLKGEKSE